MPENKPQRLNEVVDALAPQGANDARWYMVEHQLIEAKMSISTAVKVLLEIVSKPENESEGRVAHDCYLIIRSTLADILAGHATFLSYLSDTDVPERISKMEV